MCAIAGYWSRRPMEPEVLAGWARGMADRMVRRGPDGQGLWMDAQRGLALAHRRLAIVDRSDAAAQPMVSADGDRVLVFNGEIYNHREWDEEPGGGDGKAGRGGDTAALLRAIGRWGVEEACRRARGMFALAVYDRRTQRLTLARDRLGEKPLFVAQGPWGMAFASDFGALMPLPTVDRTVRQDVLRETLQWGCASSRGTLVRGIERVMPGEIQTYTVQGLESRRAWWSLPQMIAASTRPEARVHDAAQAVQAVHEALRDSVRERMVADVPVGVFLSGGIDSSLVAALMADAGTAPPHSHAIGFDDPLHDESAAAQRIAQALGTRHQTWTVTGSDARDLMSSLPLITGEPLADASQLPTTMLALKAGDDLRVVLTGDGGDEAFGGYERYRQSRGWMGQLAAWPRPLRHGLASMVRAVGPTAWNRLAHCLPAARRPTLPASKAAKLARWLGQDTAQGRMGVFLGLWDPQDLMGPERPSRWSDPPPSDAGSIKTSTDSTGSWDELVASEAMQAWEMAHSLPGDLLAKMDRATMWASVEARSPLLDERVVELAWRISPALKAEGPRTKEVLRQCLARHLDPALFDRPKRGFSAPLPRWLRQELREPAAECLDSLCRHTRGRWNTALIERAWAQQQAGASHEADRLWGLVVLEQWRQQWGLEWPGEPA